MSEMEAAPVAESAPVADSAPQSTQDIAASVIQEAEQAELGTPEEPQRIVQQAEPAEKPKADTPASKAAEFLRRMGHDLKRSDGRRAFMPLDAVAKMLDNYAEEHGQTFTSERQTLQQKIDEYEAERQSMYNDIRNPRQLLEKLSEYIPEYKTYLTPQQATQIAQTAQTIQQEMPQPDIALSDGSRTYSLEGIQKLLDWKTAQVEAKFNSVLDDKLKPLTEREQREQQRQQQEQAAQVRREQVRAQMEDAQTWPLFKEHSDAILRALQEDSAEARKTGRPLKSLDAIYRMVVMPKIVADKNTQRAELLQEVAAAPKAPALVRSGGGSTRQAGPRSTADIARDVIAKAEASN